MIPFWALLIISYLLGSIPMSYLVTQFATGKDIRTLGSGNPGATNVWRSVGKTAGLLTLSFDVLKGYLPVFISGKYLDLLPLAIIPVGLAAICGHTFSLFLRFKGGKGVATAGGVFLALLPVPTLAAIIAFLLALAISRHVAVGSLTAAATLPLAAAMMHFEGKRELLIFVSAIALLIWFKHIPNIRNLLKGERREEG